MPQWAVKAIVVGAYLLPALWVLFLALTFSWRTIRSEYVTLSWLNPFRISERYAAEELEGKIRVSDAIYQDEMIVARVRGEPDVDEKSGVIIFPELIRAENLETTRPFLFRRWELELAPPAPGFSSFAAGGPFTVSDKGVEVPEHYGRVLTRAHCRIRRSR